VGINIFKKKDSSESVSTATSKPTRGPDGKFISSKKTSTSSSSKPIKSVKKITNKKRKKGEDKNDKVLGPFIISFYGHDVRRFYKDKTWFFSIEDILQIPDKNPEDKDSPKGDREKLNKAREKYSGEIVYKVNDNEVAVECTDSYGIIEICKHAEGVFPGPFQSWLEENAVVIYSKEMFPDPNKILPIIKRPPATFHPSDSGG